MGPGHVRRKDRGVGGWRPEGVLPPENQTTHVSTEWNVPQRGECRPGICGGETACKRFPNNTFKCLCPHDLSRPTADLKCPNRSTVPLRPIPIHNIIPPSGENSTSRVNISTSTEMIEKATELDRGVDLIAIVAPVSVLLFVLVMIALCICWKWKSLNGLICKDKSVRKAEAPHTGEPLLAERYITNPQYSSAYSVSTHSKGPAVPLLVREALAFVDEIGEGCFGKVYKGELKIDASTTTLVAIKVLKETASRTAEDDFIREVNIMSAFRHENILTLIGVVRENGLNPCMVFEFMPFGDLTGVLRSNSHTMRQTYPGLPILDSKSLLFIALQVARGMKYLAAQRFVHRDLACRNCLVGDELIVKIADFGMSRDVYTSDYYKMGGNKPMPIRWMSPESIVYARFTLESDVWSYGVVLWEIYSLGKQPYYGHINEGASKLILQGIMLIPPDDCPAYICELMRACWRTEPKDRIRFQEVCDKLQTIYDNDNWEDSPESDNESKPNENDSWILSYDNRNKWSVESNTQLPLPPTEICKSVEADLIDPEGYLLPALPGFQDYLTTLPD